MELMETWCGAAMAQPHPVTLSGGLVHFQTDMAAPLEIIWSAKNLFDATSAVRRDGYLINTSGVEIESTTSGYFTTYVPVSPETQYTMTGETRFGIYYYDATKAWLERTAAAYNTPFDFTTPSNCYFIRIQYRLSDLNTSTVQIKAASGNITVCGKNLFDKTAATQGKYINSSGAIVNTPSGYNWSLTDYIPVSGFSKVKYRRNGTAGTAPYSAWYKADKTLISTWKQKASTANATINDVEVPTNAAYMRMSILFNDINEDNCMIVEGNDTISDYEAYAGITLPVGTPRKSLVGVNNIWSDSGNLTVTYWTH